MTLLNILLLALNLFSLVSVLRYHLYKKDQMKHAMQQANEALNPALFRDHIQKQECCMICKGSTPHKPAGYPRTVSVHDLCLNRYNAGEVQVKKVGKVSSEQPVNLKELQLIVHQKHEIKLLQ